MCVTFLYVRALLGLLLLWARVAFQGVSLSQGSFQRFGLFCSFRVTYFHLSDCFEVTDVMLVIISLVLLADSGSGVALETLGLLSCFCLTGAALWFGKRRACATAVATACQSFFGYFHFFGGRAMPFAFAALESPWLAL